MKTFGLKATEGEVIALIHHLTCVVQNHISAGEKPPVEVSQRIHDLVKRLHKDTPEIEGDGRPEETKEVAKESLTW